MLATLHLFLYYLLLRRAHTATRSQPAVRYKCSCIYYRHYYYFYYYYIIIYKKVKTTLYDVITQTHTSRL